MAKKDEITALHQLDLALTHLGIAVENLKKAADIDDQVTARQEMEELRDRAYNIEKDTRNLREDLDTKRSR